MDTKPHPTIEAAIQAAAEKAAYEIWTETTSETPRDTLKRIIVRHATEELSHLRAVEEKAKVLHEALKE